MIPAGGNAFYALTQDGLLKWYRHDGFNDGSFNWKGPVDVGRGWAFNAYSPAARASSMPSGKTAN